jgi:hypothetical protein
MHEHKTYFLLKLIISPLLPYTGVATTEKPDDDRFRKKQQTELVIPDEPPSSNDHLYLLLGCLFAGFWIFLCIACALCYKCKQKRGLNN